MNELGHVLAILAASVVICLQGVIYVRLFTHMMANDKDGIRTGFLLTVIAGTLIGVLIYIAEITA